jgi:hypothetical protein
MRLYPPYRDKKKELQDKFRPLLDKWNRKNPNEKRIFVYYSPKRHKYIKIYL